MYADLKSGTQILSLVVYFYLEREYSPYTTQFILSTLPLLCCLQFHDCCKENKYNEIYSYNFSPDWSAPMKQFYSVCLCLYLTKSLSGHVNYFLSSCFENSCCILGMMLAINKYAL